MKRFLFWIAALFILVSCNEDAERDAFTNTTIETPEILNTVLEIPDAESRAYIDHKRYIHWSAGDEISYFPGVMSNMQYRLKDEEGAANGSFEKITTSPASGTPLNYSYAVYPYAEGILISENETLVLELPSVQQYAENSFGVGANTMVAVAEREENPTLAFKNACGYLKLQLYGAGVDVRKITLKGNDNEKIAGSVQIEAIYKNAPIVKMDENASSTIVLDCQTGVTLNDDASAPTTFWLVIPEMTFEKGFTVTVTDTKGYIFEKSTSNKIAIKRNCIQPMAAVEVVCENPVPSTQIWYTAKLKITLNRTDGFGVSLISHKFDATTGMGVLTFGGEITAIGSAAFAGCLSLVSVGMPNSVKSINASAFKGCSLLEGVTMSNAIVRIEDSAFESCVRLANVVLPDNITNLGAFAFGYCASLTSATIPEKVTTIGREAFVDCSSLVAIYCRPILPPAIYYAMMSSNGDTLRWGVFPFHEGLKIYVPQDAYESYTQYSSFSNQRTEATNWFAYKSYIEPYDF